MTHQVDLQIAQLEVCLTQTYDESLGQYHRILQDYAMPIVLYLLLIYEIKDLSKFTFVHNEK